MSELSSRNDLIEVLKDLKYFIENSRIEYDSNLKVIKRKYLYVKLGEIKFRKDKHISILDETIKRLKNKI